MNNIIFLIMKQHAQINILHGTTQLRYLVEFNDILDETVTTHGFYQWDYVPDGIQFFRNTYVINNFGSTMSLSSLAEYFEKHEQISIRTETLNNYLQILENAKIIYKCPRFDVKSKKSLRGEQKYYLADLGIYFSRNVDARINYGPSLENIVYT